MLWGIYLDGLENNPILMKKTVVLLILGATLFSVFVFLYIFYYNQLKGLGLNSTFLKAFSIDNKVTTKLKNIKVTSLYFRRNDEKIRIKKTHPVTTEKALKKMNGKSILIESVFHPKPAPYFAILTKEINCPREFLPLHRKKEGLWMAWTMFANKRQGFGVCDKSEVYFINYKLLKYCPAQKNFFEIDYFTPVKKQMKKSFDLDLKKSSIQLETLFFCS